MIQFLVVRMDRDDDFADAGVRQEHAERPLQDADAANPAILFWPVGLTCALTAAGGENNCGVAWAGFVCCMLHGLTSRTCSIAFPDIAPMPEQHRQSAVAPA
jgi:hypothetical protein